MILGYARVSSEAQDLTRQVDELVAAGCDRVITEKASGKRGARRPEWEALIDPGRGVLRAGDTLMVVELSRLGRSTTQLTQLLDDLRDRGIALRILTLGIDTSSPAGQLIFSIVAAVAQMERDLIAERTRSALDAKRRRGEPIGGRRRSISDEKIRQAAYLLEHSELTGSQVAAAVGISKSRMYARVAELREG